MFYYNKKIYQQIPSKKKTRDSRQNEHNIKSVTVKNYIKYVNKQLNTLYIITNNLVKNKYLYTKIKKKVPIHLGKHFSYLVMRSTIKYNTKVYVHSVVSVFRVSTFYGAFSCRPRCLSPPLLFSPHWESPALKQFRRRPHFRSATSLPDLVRMVLLVLVILFFLAAFPPAHTI